MLVRMRQVIGLLLLLPARALSQRAETGFVDRVVEVNGTPFRYQVYVPADYRGSQARWPVILFLHGAGERGADGLVQTNVGIASAIRSASARYPALVVMPQVPTDSVWIGAPADAAMLALDATVAEYRTDPDRVYLTGLSMGGNGAWNRVAVRAAPGAPVDAMGFGMRYLASLIALYAVGSSGALAQDAATPPARLDSVAAMSRRSVLASLAAGRRRWRAAAIDEYQLQTRLGVGEPAPLRNFAPIEVLGTVLDGRLVERAGGKQIRGAVGPATIEALFTLVEVNARDTGTVARALALHPRYGFPVHYFSARPSSPDGELEVDVDSFAVLHRPRVVPLGPADSALVGRILLAEDRRDTTDVALARGARHADPRIRALVLRARIRTRDARAVGRDSLDPPRAPLVWPLPDWEGWGREIGASPVGCAARRLRIEDDPWPVRLRSADAVTAACASDDTIAARLRGWIDALPDDASQRARDGVAWQGAAHGLVALARMRPADAAPRVRALRAHRRWQVRAYAARAAGVLADTVTLRSLARDPTDNVKAAAVDALSAVTHHADDSLYLATLAAAGAPAVRAAAVALRGSQRAEVAAAANAAFERWVVRGNASERDVRVALLEAAGRPATDDRPPAPHYELPARAVALALGADVRLRVRMAAAGGGGSFVVRLRGDVAPMMAARILALARAHYYDGLAWHRVEHDFVIQGGSPGSDEYVGLPHYLRDELGRVPHVRGTVGMSTRGHDTGDAQWFVNLRDNLRLNRDYTVFGEVVEGMDVVDGILEGDVIATIEEVGGR